jgi:hypothetical protein
VDSNEGFWKAKRPARRPEGFCDLGRRHTTVKQKLQSLHIRREKRDLGPARAPSPRFLRKEEMRPRSTAAALLGACAATAAMLGALGLGRGEQVSVDRSRGRVVQSTCGQPGLAPCPLQRFMRENVAAPLARGDNKLIAESLRRVEAIAPSDFATWALIARQGAAAAEQGDTAALRSACNACHQAYRAEYRSRYRARPL